MGAGQPVPGRAMAGPESEAPRQDWRQAAGQDVASVGEDDERPEKEQRDAAAESSCIPIDIGGEGEEGEEEEEEEEKEEKGREGELEDWWTSKWQAEEEEEEQQAGWRTLLHVARTGRR